MAEKKKGDYRVVVKMEVVEDHGLYKKGDVIEVHPVLSKKLLMQSVAKPYVAKPAKA